MEIIIIICIKAIILQLPQRLFACHINFKRGRIQAYANLSYDTIIIMRPSTDSKFQNEKVVVLPYLMWTYTLDRVTRKAPVSPISPLVNAGITEFCFVKTDGK